jgi:hypothetical protein
MCLIDADNDSAFEAYYYVYSTAASLSVQAGTLFNIKPIQKLPYKPLNREKYETSLERFIVYIGKSKKGNFIFAEGFGEKNTEFNDKTAINSYLSLSSIQLGKSFDLFGITVEPISSTDKSLILKIVKPSEQHAEQVDINLEYRVYVTLY